MLYANLIGHIAFFTGENIAHIELYLQGLLPKILAIYTINCNMSFVTGHRDKPGFGLTILMTIENYY